MAWGKEWLIVGTEIVKSQLKTEEEAWKNALHQDDSKGDIDFNDENRLPVRQSEKMP